MDPSGWPRYTFGAGLLGCVKYIMLVTQGNVLGCFLGSPGCGYQSVCALSQQVMHHILGIFIERHERAVSAERVGVEPHTAITATSRSCCDGVSFSRIPRLGFLLTLCVVCVSVRERERERRVGCF